MGYSRVRILLKFHHYSWDCSAVCSYSCIYFFLHGLRKFRASFPRKVKDRDFTWHFFSLDLYQVIPFCFRDGTTLKKVKERRKAKHIGNYNGRKGGLLDVITMTLGHGVQVNNMNSPSCRNTGTTGEGLLSLRINAASRHALMKKAQKGTRQPTFEILPARLQIATWK